MEEFIKWLECIQDMRQQSKVRYTVQEVVLIVFCSTLSRVENWEDRAVWAEYYLDYLRAYLPYENGVPSHDTMQRVMGMIATEYFQQAYNKWIEAFERGEGINLRKIVCIDGKTMRGNKQNESKPNHIITAWSKEGGYSLGQKIVEEKSNEITAIPQLLDVLHIKGSVITIDAMGTQTAIAEKIREKRCHYVLAVKENQRSLYEDISLYLEDEKHLKKIIEKGNHKKTVDKNHGMADVREYYQTTSISWLSGKEKWKGIKSIGMVVRTFHGVTEKRYYISSLPCNIEEFASAIRGHWSVEAMHWQLDVTFKEDANHTLDKTAAANMNIIRKWCLSMLKHVPFYKPNLSMRQKMFLISLDPAKHLDYVMSL
ncbi:MAG: ISAs1 family transposase [Oscillospiraceae bacterium]|nr:ISAs1 family transposase [Oscillospiraceae bacterium]